MKTNKHKYWPRNTRSFRRDVTKMYIEPSFEFKVCAGRNVEHDDYFFVQDCKKDFSLRRSSRWVRSNGGYLFLYHSTKINSCDLYHTHFTSKINLLHFYVVELGLRKASVLFRKQHVEIWELCGQWLYIFILQLIWVQKDDQIIEAVKPKERPFIVYAAPCCYTEVERRFWSFRSSSLNDKLHKPSFV